MLYIDDKNFEITSQEIYVGTFINNGDHGYNACIQLVFINISNNETGYINLDFGFEKDCDITSFMNKKYNGKPFDDDDNQYIHIEVFDTEKFLDTQIEGTMIIELKNIKDDKIEASFELNDELIKIKFSGYLVIDYSHTKETF